MSENQEWTVGRLLTWTTDYLRQNRADNPRLDAEVLLAHARGCERIMLYTAFSDVVSEEVRTAFRALVKGRAAGTPVAYLVGHKEFFSLAFQVTPAVLIPRPETEFLVTAALDVLKTFPAAKQPPRVVDVGTGSGAIAVSIAVHHPTCAVTAVDISPAALTVAQANAAQHQVSNRIQFQQADLLAPFANQQPWDLIVSNPPYIGEQERATLAKEVIDHEPALALFGGPTGIETTTRLIQQAAAQLVSGGWLLLEISSLFEKEILALLSASETWQQVSISKDLSQLPRVARAQRR